MVDVVSNIQWHPQGLSRQQRWQYLGQSGATVWFTGLSGSGKSTIAAEVERRLVASGRAAYLLDGDNLRHGITAGLGFSPADRDENVRRIAEVAALMADAGLVALVSVISPFSTQRANARARHVAAGLTFIEAWVATPLEECEQRDPKGLYARARRGDIKGFTGIDAPYEQPVGAELVLGGPAMDVASSAEAVLGKLDGCV